ncbi:MAG: transglutaminase-like domain-containing protein [Planctomycetota bacterium]
MAALLPPCAARGEVYGIIVHGLVADGAIEKDWKTQEHAWVSALVARRAQPKNIRVIEASSPDDRTVRGQLLSALNDWRTELRPGDEAYLVMLGSGATRNGRYRFDVRGPRVTGKDLVSATQALPASRLWVVLPGPGGRGLVDLLAKPGVNVISATDHERQLNHPRFGGIMAEQMIADPGGDLAALAGETNRYVASYYKERKLVRTETAGVWLDGERVDLQQYTEETQADATDPSPAVFDATKLPGDLIAPAPDDPYQIRAHTPEEARRLKEASEIEKTENAMAVVVRRDIAMDLKSDGSALWNESGAMLIHDLRGRGLIDGVWTSKCTSTGCSAVRLKALRVVRPDGYTLEWDYQAPPPMLLPGMLPGAYVEYDFETVANKPPVPFYVGQIALGLPGADVLEQSIRLTRPPTMPLRHKLASHGGRSIEETQDQGLTYTAAAWTVGRVQPVDDPRDSPRILLSGFEDWDQVSSFYAGMMRDTVGDADAVAKAARSWTQGLSNRYEKIAALYEQVNGFRYNTIPLGVRGLRPEPASEVIQSRYGDCKAKANLLVELLASLDIEAHFVLVERGGDRTPLDPDFPQWKFNHAVAVVPDPLGTGEGPPLWLDATDEIAPIGMMPPGDPGQSALVLAEKPYLATIPAFYEADSLSDDHTNPLADSVCRLELVAGKDGLTGTAVWELRGLMAYEWRATQKYGNETLINQFETRCNTAWPTAEVTNIVAETSEINAPQVIKAELRFPHAVTPLNQDQHLLSLPGPWNGDRLPTAQNTRPNGGYPGAFTQQLILTWPTDWQLPNPPAVFYAASPDQLSTGYAFSAEASVNAAKDSVESRLVYEASVKYRGLPDFADLPSAAAQARAWRAHLATPLVYETRRSN